MASEREELKKYRSKEEGTKGKGKGKEQPKQLIMLWMEWTLCLLITGAKLCIEDAKSPQMHSMWKPRAPFTVLPTKERRCMMGPSEASFMQTTEKVADLLHRRIVRSSNHIEGGDMDKDSNQEGKHKDQDNEEESDLLHANTIEEYYGKRVFIFLHHFAGPNDPSSAEIQKEATAAGIKVKCISVEKSSGTGDLLQDEPYNTHLGWAHNGYIDAYHSGFPCTTFSKLRFRPAEGL